MPQLNGIHGLSTPTINVLIGAYGNDMVNITTGNGYGLALTPTASVEFESFLGRLFFQNGIDRPLSSDGNTWSTLDVQQPPIGKYIKVWRSRSRMYVGFVTIQGTVFPSKVMYCDLPNNNMVQWGYDYGNSLITHKGNKDVSAINTGFKTYGIKRGDPIYILSGNDIGEYKVLAVGADQQLTLDTAMTTNATGISFWVGGNWFDISPDDGDFITWLEENNDILHVFKRDSLYRINQSDGSSITKVRGAYGTTSGRSVVNMHELTLYWYAGSGLSTGIYAYNGLYSQKISGPIENHIQGINLNVQPIAWREGELYRCYVGDITNLAEGISIKQAVLTWDYFTKTWSIDPLTDIPTVATEFRQSSIKQTYFGTTNSSVMVTPQGNTYNGQPIGFLADLSTMYPAGPGMLCEFTRVQIISSAMKGLKVQYRLVLKPYDSDGQFRDLGSLDNDRTELLFRTPDASATQASGINFRFLSSDGTPAEGVLQRITLFFRPKTTILG